MVTQELVFLRYLLKNQFMFLALPFVFILTSFFLEDGSKFSEIMMLFTFPMLVFPIIALLGPIGSIHHKELFVTFPIKVLFVAVIRPLGMITLFSGIFTFALKVSGRYDFLELLGAFIACLLYMIITEFCLIMFKNIALSVIIPICYVMYGMFTTGSGLGILYLTQWGRANPQVTLTDCITTQLSVLFLLIFLCPYFLKKRNKYFV